MIVYYEEFHDSNGTLLLLELVISGDTRSASLGLMSAKSKADFAILNAYLKSIPGEKRTYDATTHIWTYQESTGAAVISAIEGGIKAGLLSTVTAKKITDLQDKAAKAQLNRVDKAPRANAPEVEIKFDEKEFFYTPEPSTKQITGEILWKKLGDLLGLPMEQIKSSQPKDLKRAYFKAAQKYHPDLNGGDGSKMSELNMLWAIYNG